MAEMEIRPPKGSRKAKRISGRGPGGRRGATAGKGDKGQNSRSGGGVRPGFEGGQMPLYRRIPIKGFSNYPFKKTYEVVNVGVLENKYADGETVSLETLKEKRVIKKKFAAVKLLGNGELSKKLTVELEKVSKSAREKIEKAGGTVVGGNGDDAAKTDSEDTQTKAEKKTEPKPEKKAEPKAEKTAEPKPEKKDEKKTEEKPVEDSVEEEGKVDGE